MRKFVFCTLGLYLTAAGVVFGQDDGALPARQSGKIATPAPSANEKLAKAIAARLRANAKLKHYQVDVEVTDGVVELTGRVDNIRQRDEVVQSVRSMRGVRRVDEHLLIAEDFGPYAPAAAMAPPTANPAAGDPQQADANSVQPAVVAGQSSAPGEIETAQVQPTPGFVPQPTDAGPVQVIPGASQFMPMQVVPQQTYPGAIPMAPAQMMPMPMMQMPMQMAPMQMMQPQYVGGPPQPVMQPGMAPRAGMPPEPLPIFSAQPGMPNPHLQPPPLPPYAWPTFAPYNNVSRVAYPNNYPYEAWPFIGPIYPFPQVPLGWRNVTLGWRDGYWWYGRDASGHDWWRIRYW